MEDYFGDLLIQIWLPDVITSVYLSLISILLHTYSDLTTPDESTPSPQTPINHKISKFFFLGNFFGIPINRLRRLKKLKTHEEKGSLKSEFRKF